MSKPKVFTIMPFQEEFLKLYDTIKNEFRDEYDFSNAGDLDNQQNIMKDVVVGIYEADIIISDLTLSNPNVFYELGLCHALNKKVIIITQELEQLPFDIRAYRTYQYSTDFWSIPELIAKLREYLSGAIDGTTQFGNPIIDFMPADTKVENIDKKQEQKDISEKISVDGERGLLDFIADIEEDTIKLSDEITLMTEELNTMTDKINNGTEGINNIPKTGGSNIASYARNIARQVAGSINDFTNKMKNHNINISELWGKIENNYLDLIDNKYMDSEENRAKLINSLEELKNMQKAINTSNIGVKEMINAFKPIKGIESRMTLSVNSLETHMNKYLFVMNSTVASVDRIIAKSEIALNQN